MTEPAGTGTHLSPAREREVLRHGDLEIAGRILPASNVTYLAEAVLGDDAVACVYKPVTGERPLWDFPDGTLAAREVAAYEVSEALGWNVVPLTLMRDGPSGRGMVQAWREPDPEQDPVDLAPVGETPAGYRHVLDAVDADDRPVALVHEDSPALRRMAAFDAVVNNSDRKGGHVLPMTDGHRFGVDHGVSFHVDPKLRTVLWGWAGEGLHPADVPALDRLAVDLRGGGVLVTRLTGLLSTPEVTALTARLDALLRRGRMPLPSPGWPAIPWPAF
jgi:uncharacterized repeat protein (TIGR03843 family)